VGSGRLITLGTFLGAANHDRPALETFVSALAHSVSVGAPVAVGKPLPSGRDFIQVQCGLSGGRRMVYVFFPREKPVAKVTLRFAGAFEKAGTFRDLVSGASYNLKGNNLSVSDTDMSMAILVEA
jgi:hypothetical protein